MNKKTPAPVKVQCSECGGSDRNHRVIYDHTETHWSPDGDIGVFEHFQIVKCMGCDTVRFRQFHFCTEDMNPKTGELAELDIHIFPTAAKPKHIPQDDSRYPEDVRKMFLETIKSFNAGANTLAGGGLRATVEAICKDRKVLGNTLQQQIDALVQRGVLAKAQAELLHEERYIGNVALHEMKTPTDQDVEDGLSIVEGLMNTLYVLPVHATRLKEKRTKASKTKRAGKKRK